MNIVVCVKQVPDTWSERTLRAADSTLDRDAADAIINELDEYAIEEGLQMAEAHGGEVTILSMGPQRASESIRKALSMGADKAIHLVDDALAGSDAIQTSAALAAVLQRAARSHHQEPRRVARHGRPQRNALGRQLEVEEIGAHGFA